MVRKHYPMIIAVLMLFCLMSNIRLMSQLSEIRDELSEIEVTNTVIAMSNSNKKISVVSDKFFDVYLPKAEGYRDSVYRCASGDLTIGYGTNLSKNRPEKYINQNCLSVDSLGRYSMTQRQAKRAAGLWIGENMKWFESYSEQNIGLPFIELPQEIKDFIVLVAYKSGGSGLIQNKKDMAKYIGEFMDSDMNVDSEIFNNMISAAGGDENRQKIYRSIFD